MFVCDAKRKITELIYMRRFATDHYDSTQIDGGQFLFERINKNRKCKDNTLKLALKCTFRSIFSGESPFQTR